MPNRAKVEQLAHWRAWDAMKAFASPDNRMVPLRALDLRSSQPPHSVFLLGIMSANGLAGLSATDGSLSPPAVIFPCFSRVDMVALGGVQVKQPDDGISGLYNDS